jgi:tRNA(fMet)-specific endonuclease VapC
MTYIWDTNILLHTLKTPAFFTNLDSQYHFFSSQNQVIISAVTVGEIQSLALRNRWGIQRQTELQRLLKKLNVVPISDDSFLIKLYAEIDVYSQSKHPTLRMPTSARKMGKNDLWIAATTAIAQGTLITTDLDFVHLNGVFIQLDTIVV